MKKPDEFREWCKAKGIAPRSHDFSVALAAWTECEKQITAKMSKECGHTVKKKEDDNDK